MIIHNIQPVLKHLIHSQKGTWCLSISRIQKVNCFSLWKVFIKLLHPPRISLNCFTSFEHYAIFPTQNIGRSSLQQLNSPLCFTRMVAMVCHGLFGIWWEERFEACCSWHRENLFPCKSSQSGRCFLGSVGDRGDTGVLVGDDNVTRCRGPSLHKTRDTSVGLEELQHLFLHKRPMYTH